MNLDYVPLLRVMRELHDIPRGQPPDFNGMKRFRHYLRTIFDYRRKFIKLPLLLAMNPMGKDQGRRTVRENLLVPQCGIAADRAFPAAVAELDR